MSRATARLARIPTDEPEAVDADLSAIRATSLFCDDIRPEASGKVTIIGHYPGETCYLHPTSIIDRCAVYTNAVLGTGIPPDRLQLRVDLPGRDPGYFPVRPAKVDENRTMPGYLLQCILHLRFSPLRPGDEIHVFVRAGSAEIHAGRLLIRRWQAPMPAVAELTRH